MFIRSIVKGESSLDVDSFASSVSSAEVWMGGVGIKSDYWMENKTDNFY